MGHQPLLSPLVGVRRQRRRPGRRVSIFWGSRTNTKLSLLRGTIGIFIIISIMMIVTSFLQRPTSTSTSRVASSFMITRQHQQHQQKLASSSSFSSSSSSFSLRLSSSDSSTTPSLNNSSSSTSSSSSFRNHLLQPVDLDLTTTTNKDTTTNGRGQQQQQQQLQLQLKHHFFALRHGESLANVAGVIASNPNIACNNYGLSDVGKKQAKEAGQTLIAAYLSATQQPTTTETSDDDSSSRSQSQSQSPTGIVIVSSDLLRAKETAQIVADTIKLYNDNTININGREDCYRPRIPLLVHNNVDKNNDNDVLSTSTTSTSRSTSRSSSITIDIRLRERGFGDWDGGNDIHYNDVWKEDAIDPYHTKNNVESVWSVIDRSTRCVIDWDKNDQKSVENRVGVHCDDKKKENEHEIQQQHGGYYWIICVAHGDVLQILQTSFNENIDPSQHRSIQHLETATLRSLL